MSNNTNNSNIINNASYVEGICIPESPEENTPSVAERTRNKIKMSEGNGDSELETDDEDKDKTWTEMKLRRKRALKKFELCEKKPIREGRKKNEKKVKVEEDEPAIEKMTMFDLIRYIPRKKEEKMIEKEKVEIKVEPKREVEIILEDTKELIEARNSEKMKARKITGVPQLKVNANGKIVLDMDSVTVEQTDCEEARKAVSKMEVIAEDNRTFKGYKKTVSKRWSEEETNKFFKMLSIFKTDFSMMLDHFPGRTRACLKNMYKRAERDNVEKVMKALSVYNTLEDDELDPSL